MASPPHTADGVDGDDGGDGDGDGDDTVSSAVSRWVDDDDDDDEQDDDDAWVVRGASSCARGERFCGVRVVDWRRRRGRRRRWW